MKTHPTLHLSLPKTDVRYFTPLFGRGVQIRATVNASLQCFLENDLNLKKSYIQQTLQTVFVNGRAVDDFDAVTLAQNDVIALSAAMPGLVGATLRKAGHLSAMRSAISCMTNPVAGKPQTGVITLKLFNLILRDLGHGLLTRGVGAPADSLRDCLGQIPDHSLMQTNAIEWNEQIVVKSQLMDRLEQTAWIDTAIQWVECHP